MTNNVPQESLAQDIFTRTQKITSGDIETSQQLITKLFLEVKTFSQEAENHIAQKNMPDLAKLFHKLAGLAGYFGATHLFNSIVKLEELAKQNDWQKLEPQLEIFHQETGRLLAAEEELKQLLNLYL